MGHDISAYLGPVDPADPLVELENADDLPETAYLRRSAFEPLRHTLYEVLDTEEYDGGVSGLGAGRWFSRDQFQAALVRLRQRLGEGWQVQPEIDFVQECLAALPPNRTSVFIIFG